MIKVLIVCGPTATGKTALAARLAKKFNGELISADSRQVYKGMDIVTGKDRPKGVVIHGLDLVYPDEEFSVGHFVKYAGTLINQISRLRRLPIIVGGTGLYLKSLVYPPETIMIKPDWKLRRQLEKKSIQQLQRQLKRISPDKFKAMNRSDRLNPRRLIRAIEVESLRRQSSKVPKKTVFGGGYDTLWVGLKSDRKILDSRIARRVMARVKAGAVKEWQKLKAKYSPGLPSMSGIGYKELPDIAAWARAEQKYARRQLVWFKKNPAINWNPPHLVKLVSSWYTNGNEPAAKS